MIDAEAALSEEYREVYAAVVDAQMRVRRQVQGGIEKFCAELGMPTRSEVNSIGERLQALRREFREERESAGEHEDLVAEVAALREELSTLKAAPTAAAASVKAAGPVEVAKSKKFSRRC